MAQHKPKVYSAEEIYNLANKSIAYLSSDYNRSSGVVISNDGLILSNYHCYSDCNLKVQIGNKIYSKIEVVNAYPEFDLILLKVYGKKLFPLELAKDENLVIGSVVYAIGTPIQFELRNTISNGIISGIRLTEGDYHVQTNALIYPGNSGGALINSYGELIGITSSGIANMIGLSLAVHLKYLKQFIKDKKSKPKSSLLKYNKYLHNGQLQFERNEYQKALKSFNIYLQYYPKNCYAYYLRGQVFETVGYLSEAISDYKKCVKYNRNLDLPYIGDTYAALYRLEKSRSKKEEYLNTIHFTNYNDEDKYLLLGNRDLEKKDYKLAEMMFYMVLRINPESSKAYAKLAELNYKQGNISKAISYLKNAIGYTSKDKDQYYYEIALLNYNINYKGQKDVYTEILDYLYSAININNTNPYLHFLFCKCYVDLFNYPKAYEFILAASFYDKNNTIVNSPEYQYYYGVVIKNLQKDFTYKTYFVKALDLLKNNLPLDGKPTYEQKQERYNELELSAEIHYEMGEYETAKKEF